MTQVLYLAINDMRNLSAVFKLNGNSGVKHAIYIVARIVDKEI